MSPEPPDAHEDPRADHVQAQREGAAQTHLAELAGDAIGPRPWRPAPVPPAAVDLVHFALWRDAQPDPDDLQLGQRPDGPGEPSDDDRDVLLSALTLLPAARAEVEALETGLLFAARNAGLTWARIAEAMGFRSPQACQQRYMRLTTRRERGS